MLCFYWVMYLLVWLSVMKRKSLAIFFRCFIVLHDAYSRQLGVSSLEMSSIANNAVQRTALVERQFDATFVNPTFQNTDAKH